MLGLCLQTTFTLVKQRTSKPLLILLTVWFINVSHFVLDKERKLMKKSRTALIGFARLYLKESTWVSSMAKDIK
jgi:hypothetical protein